MTSRGYVPGAWNANCAMCGFAYKSFELRKDWKGLWKCSMCFETRHPQEFVRALPGESPPAWTQAHETHPQVTICTPNGMSAVPGFAVPGCMIPGYLHPFFDAEVEDAAIPE